MEYLPTPQFLDEEEDDEQKNFSAGPIYYIEKPYKNKYCKEENLISDKNDKISIYKINSIELTEEEKKNDKVILLIGQTGNGKTTLINFLINVLLGIEYDDNFRFKIIVEEKRSDESKSNTSGVHSYNLKVDGYPFPIVKETDIRIGSSQQYIYKSILDLFAKDIKSNFVLMMTNSHFEEDPENIELLKSLNSEESFFKSVIPFLEKPYYFQFENGSLYKKGSKKRFKMDFEESMDNMKEFLNNKLINLKPVKTKNSLNVLVERIQQRLICRNLFNKRQILINKKKILEKNQFLLMEAKSKIIDDPNIKIENYEYELIQKPLPNGKHNTVCKNCKENCHEGCFDTKIFGIDFLKYWCACFGKTGFCKICKNKCYMNKHENVNFEYYSNQKSKELTLDEIFKQKCEKSPEKKDTIDKIKDLINQNNIEIKNIQNESELLLDELNKGLLKLNDLALNKINFQITIKIFEDLIKQEESIGNNSNAEILKQQKKEFILLRETQTGEENDKIIDKYEKANCILY